MDYRKSGFKENKGFNYKLCFFQNTFARNLNIGINLNNP